MKKRVVCAVVVALFSVGAVFGQQGSAGTKDAQFEQVVRRLFDEYSAALLRGDPWAWISLWDQDAVQLVPNSLMTEGKDTISVTTENILRAIRYDQFDIQLTAAFSDGRYGYAYGSYRFQYTNGAVVQRFGKFLTVFKREPNGTWKIVADCTNLNT